MMMGPSFRPSSTKLQTRSPNKRRTNDTDNPETPNKASEKEKKNVVISPSKSIGSPRPMSASRSSRKHGSLDPNKSVDISLKSNSSEKSQKKVGTSGGFSRLATPRANQMKDDTRSESVNRRMKRHDNHEMRRSASTPKNSNRPRGGSGDTKGTPKGTLLGQPVVRKTSKPSLTTPSFSSPISSTSLSSPVGKKDILPTSSSSITTKQTSKKGESKQVKDDSKLSSKKESITKQAKDEPKQMSKKGESTTKQSKDDVNKSTIKKQTKDEPKSPKTTKKKKDYINIKWGFISSTKS